MVWNVLSFALGEKKSREIKFPCLSLVAKMHLTKISWDESTMIRKEKEEEPNESFIV